MGHVRWLFPVKSPRIKGFLCVPLATCIITFAGSFFWSHKHSTTQNDWHGEGWTGSLPPQNAPRNLIFALQSLSESFKMSERFNTSIDTRPKIILGPSDMYKDKREFDVIQTVPHIIHQTNKYNSVSVIYQMWMRSWLKMNPHWQYWFWTDEDIKRFISTRYPNFKKHFYKYRYNIQRSDVFRYFLLYEYGGFYADCDVECLRSLDERMATWNCVLSTEPDIHALDMYKERPHLISNAVMACRPRHPFFEYVIKDLTTDDRLKRNDIMNTTGPLMLDKAHQEFSRHFSNPPHLADPEVFQPIADPRHLQQFSDECKKMVVEKSRIVRNFTRAKKTCAPFLNNVPQMPTDISLTVHHWVHSWLSGFQNDQFGLHNEHQTFDVADLKPSQHT